MKTSFWTKLFDLCSPRLCAICGSRLSAEQTVLCSHCLDNLPYTNYHLSPLDNPMARLFWGLFPVERAAALFFYVSKTDTKELIFDLKYHGYPEVGRAMGALMAQRFQDSQFFEGIDALVSVPLTRKRQWQRGYNQSDMIARGINDATGIPIIRKAVKRCSFKESQTKKNVWERRQNVENAFQLTNPDLIKGKHLLLIDDIVTTGSSITACATELCKAEGVKVSVLALGLTKE